MGRSYPSATKDIEDQLRAKEDKVIFRRYSEAGCFVLSITPRFGVAKGKFDVRLVWDSSRNGVNQGVWVPGFMLPTAEALHRLLTKDSWQGDMDVGEMFNNFPLHPDERKHYGWRRCYVVDGEELEEIVRWSRLFFGGTACPYAACQGMARAVETAIGDTTQEDNPFGWVRIHENYPCTPDYDASLPWLMKIRSDGKIACDKVVYVDDGQIVGHTNEAGRQAMRKLCSGLSYLGVQDAARKRRPVGQ
jgi:hypothetical protein